MFLIQTVEVYIHVDRGGESRRKDTPQTFAYSGENLNIGLQLLIERTALYREYRWKGFHTPGYIFEWNLVGVQEVPTIGYSVLRAMHVEVLDEDYNKSLRLEFIQEKNDGRHL